MALAQIEIEGFKSIRKTSELKLNNLNIFIGANGSGKSNFISVFHLLNQIVEQNLQNFVRKAGGANTLLYFGQKTTQELELRLTFENDGYRASLVPTETDSLFFALEQCWYAYEPANGSQTERQRYIRLGAGHEESKLHDESLQSNHAGIATKILDHLKSWRIYHFHDTSETAQVKLTGDVDDNAFLRADASNLAAFLYFLREQRRNYYDRIVKTVRLAAPFFDDFRLRPSPLNPNKIQLEWQEKGSDSYFKANVLSDGTLRFMSLATLLLQPDLPATIFIDEPELGLHPYAITLLASLLHRAAAQTQIIVSTQSVPLVNHFSPEDLIVVDREDNQSVFKRLREQEIEVWLEEYSLGDLWEKNIIGGRP